MARPRHDREGPTRRTGGGTPCPGCGSRSQRSGPWPWYLGTVGALLCRAVVCNDCGHEFDARKPSADLASRKLHLALAINGIGCLGILGVVGVMVLYVMWLYKR